jgi:protein-tyrosine phosphatase
MIEVYTNLCVGTKVDCFYNDRNDLAIIHACKSPCHQRALKYKGNLPNNHHYLTYEIGNHLFLNMIDPNEPLFMPPLFISSLDFIEKHISKRKVLIHCNEGLSRAPSLALLYLAKRVNVIDNESYEKATQNFLKLFPLYQPSRGIAIYLNLHWHEIK